jgi:Na+(H+)/acetate symporter ActP
MLVYNIIAEIAADQFVIIALCEIITVGIIFLVFKKRLTLKASLITVFRALILSLISTIIASRYYGGTLYHEKFGWPMQYYYVIRSI